MKQSIRLNPMQRSSLQGMELTDGLFSKACCMYRFSPESVEGSKLRQAIQLLPEVHPLLGASFTEEGLVPLEGRMQIREYEMPVNSTPEEEAERIFQAFSMNPDCLAEAVILTGATGYLMFCLNGIIADGVSHQRIIETLERLYHGESISPHLCGDEYLSYLQSREEEPYFQMDQDAAQKWVEELPEPMVLSCAEEMYVHDSRESVMRRISLSSDQWGLLQQKAASAGVTVFSLLAALIARSVGRYLEEPDFVMNIPVTSRMAPVDGLMDAVGMYSDFALVPVDLRKGDPFQLAERIGSDLLEQQMDSLSGLERLALWRRKNVHAAAPVVFTSVDDFSGDRAAALFTRTFLRTQTSQTWLELLLCRLDESICLEAICQPSRFPVAAMEELLAAVRKEIDALRSPEEVGPKAESDPLNRSLKQWMEQGFSEHREQPLLLWSSGQKSYEETQGAASCLSRRLLEQTGFHSGRTRVGILLPKGPMQAVASFAATLAGAAFLPLDLDYPPETMAKVVERAGLSLLIVQEETQVMAKQCGMPYLCLDDSLLNQTDPRPVTCYDWQLEEIAVIINTSGTTGEPKSAGIKAEGLLNCFLDSMTRFSMKEGLRCIAVTNFCHDMALFDLYGMLACGGSIVFPDADKTREPAHWAELMNRFHVTFWNSVPAFLEMLTADEQTFSRAFVDLETVVTGGDFIPVSLAEKLISSKSDLNVFSVGGPTETTIWNISHPITRRDIEGGRIPYGKPFQNTTYYILNAAGQQLPEGVIGEMCVAGFGVSAGYLGMPEETKAGFQIWKGQRIYHTGDYGYYRHDGCLMIAGRRDGQVKINGKRIELSGIEKKLADHSEITGAVVVKGEGSGKLHAFYTGSRELKELDCKSFLEQHLPSYMIPVGFSCLEQFPLTRNGKIDRKLLVAQAEEMEHAAKKNLSNVPDSDAGEADDIERKLVSMCQELFPGEVIDEELNFYFIGGDSIQAIRLLSMIKKEFQITLSAYDILEDPFLQSWAEKIREKTESVKNTSADLIRLAEETVGAKNGVLILTEGAEEKLTVLSRELEKHGIRKNRYELLACPYLPFDSAADHTPLSQSPQPDG